MTTTALTVTDPPPGPLFAGKRLDLAQERRVLPPAALTDHSTATAQSLAPRMPNLALPWFIFEGTTKNDLFREFAPKVARIAECSQQCKKFLSTIVLANLELRQVVANPEWLAWLVDLFVQEAGADVMPVDVSGSVADLAVRSVPDIHRAMDAVLVQGTHHLVDSFFDSAQKLVNVEQLGEIRFLAPGVCRHWFHRWIIQPHTPQLHQSRSRNGTPSAAPETDIKQSLRQAIHIQEVVDAQHLALTTPVPMPERIKQLLAAIPDWPRSFTTIVTGKTVYRRVVEREHKCETPVSDERSNVFFTSYALVMENRFVLTAWSADEQ